MNSPPANVWDLVRGAVGPRYSQQYGIDNPPLNHHHIATLKEIALYKQARHSHLSALPHFQHWTTVSHTWSTSSAKLTALTVLLVGETYTRGLLPRLPFDCWCRILSMIARHEPRQGKCEPKVK